MRMLFFGATDLGHQCCEDLLDIGENVVGIFSIPEQFRISYAARPVTNVTFRSFDDLARRARVPLITVDRAMSDPGYAQAVRELQPDFALVVGWYYLIPEALRQLCPLGMAGIHASDLPRYRGGAPLVWAIINGETSTGVSLFYLSNGVDDGDIIGQERIAIGGDDDIASVYARATEASRRLVRKYVPQIRTGLAPRIPQDHRHATHVPQRSPEDGLIAWDRQTARQSHDWIRAQTRPYPGAFSFYGGERVTVWRSSVTADAAPSSLAAGSLVVDRNSVRVCCADRRLLEIREVGTPAMSAMPALEFAATRGIETGNTFQSAAT
jgi:methionyl-tRNA formyltransferase